MLPGINLSSTSSRGLSKTVETHPTPNLTPQSWLFKVNKVIHITIWCMPRLNSAVIQRTSLLIKMVLLRYKFCRLSICSKHPAAKTSFTSYQNPLSSSITCRCESVVCPANFPLLNPRDCSVLPRAHWNINRTRPPRPHVQNLCVARVATLERNLPCSVVGKRVRTAPSAPHRAEAR